MSLSIKALPGNRFAVDDGTRTLDLCPCCGLEFTTKRAAQAVVDAMGKGTLSMDRAFILVDAWRKHEAKP